MTPTLANFAQLCGGQLKGADAPYTSVSSDTRTIGPGALFVALRGPNFNGNEFVSAAAAAGAAGALVDSEQTASLPQVVVGDTQVALERAGNGWREQFTIPVVGVAGSNGKTTAKEMTAAILSQMGNCLATRGNLNNHIGVPLTLLRIDPTHRFAVVEMGANRGGEVAALVRIARPTVGMITNAGAEHLEGFGSIEGVARAEGEMVEGLAPTATAVINADDEFAHLWRKLTKARVVTFGVHAPADFKATDVRTTIGPEGFLTNFTLVCPLGSVAVTLHMGGRHNVANALAAAAAATAAGAKLEHIVAGLGAMRAVAGRLQFKKALGGAWIIDDSYNANPSSMRAGIEVLAELDGTKWLVIGDMAELGEYAPAAHTEVGELARAHGIERLFAMGGLAKLAVDSFGAGAQWFPDAQALASALVKALADVSAGDAASAAIAAAGPGAPSTPGAASAAVTGVRLLIKGSRVNRLERVVDTLVHGSTQQTSGH